MCFPATRRLQVIALALILLGVLSVAARAETLTKLRGNKVAFSPDDRILAVGDFSGTVTFWDRRTRTVTRKIKTGIVAIEAMAFSPDGRFLATSSLGLGYASGPPGQTYDNTIHVWDARTGRLRQILTGHAAVIYSLAFSQEGKFLISGSDDGTVKVWDCRRARWKMLRSLACGGRVDAVSSRGQRVAVGGTQGVQIWDYATGRLLQHLSGYWGSIYAVAMSPDATQVAAGGQDPVIRLWTIGRGTLAQKSARPQGEVSFLAFSPNGKALVVSGMAGAQVWGVHPLVKRRQLSPVGGHEQGPLLAFSHDGSLVAAGNATGPVQVWHLP